MGKLQSLLQRIKAEKLMKLSKRSVLFNWVLSYIFILLIALWSSYLTYSISAKAIEREAGLNNLASLQQLKLIIDSRLKDIDNIGVELSLNKKLQNIIFQDQPLTEYQNYLLTEIIAQLHNYKVVNGFIEDINIFLPKSNLIIRNSSLYDTSDWYKVYYESEDMPYNEFIQLLKAKHHKDYSYLHLKTAEGKYMPCIQYMQSLPIDRYRTPQATLVVNMKESVIGEYLSGYDWLRQGGSVFVLDNKNSVISSMGDINLPKHINYQYLEKSKEILTTSVGDTDYVVLHATSERTSWMYVFVMPTAVFFEKLEQVRTFSMVAMAVFLLLGILLTFYFSRRNYSPIGQMVSTFSKLSGFDRDLKKDEFRYIESSLERILQDRQEIYGKMGRQKLVLRNTFITKLLKGRMEKEVDFEECSREYGVDLYQNRFAVLLTSIEDMHNLFFEDKAKVDTGTLELVYFIIRNIFEEQAAEKNTGYVVELDNGLACLICIRMEGKDETRKELVRIAEESTKIISAKFGIELFTSISSIHEQFTAIPEAYAEAVETLEYQRLIGDQRVLEHDKISFSSEVSMLSDYQEDKRFKNFIDARDFKGAKEILDRIFNRNFYGDNSPASVPVMRFRMYTLINLVLAAVSELTARFDYDLLQRINPEVRLLKCDTLVKLKSEMYGILDDIDHYLGSKGATKNDSLIDSIMEYIGVNYADSNLNVSTISDLFGVSVPYLSKTFKKRVGKGLLEYIHFVRVEHAKTLLRGKTLSIKDVAEKTGYGNTIAFIRVFKKFEGISPGKYGRYGSAEQEAEEECEE